MGTIFFPSTLAGESDYCLYLCAILNEPFLYFKPLNNARTTKSKIKVDFWFKKRDKVDRLNTVVKVHPYRVQLVEF